MSLLLELLEGDGAEEEGAADGRPSVGQAASDLYARLGPLAWADAEHGWALLLYCAAFTAGWEEIESLVRDDPGYPGWGKALDPVVAPEKFLGWLGQFAGVRRPPNFDADDFRALILDRPRFRRGRPGALIEAARPLLTGGRRVSIIERDGSPYRVTVVTYTAETPDAAAVNAALQAAKPAGLVLTHRVDDGWTIGAAEAFYATIGDLEAGHSSVGQFESNLP